MTEAPSRKAVPLWLVLHLGNEVDPGPRQELVRAWSEEGRAKVNRENLDAWRRFQAAGVRSVQVNFTIGNPGNWDKEKDRFRLEDGVLTVTAERYDPLHINDRDKWIDWFARQLLNVVTDWKKLPPPRVES